MLYNNRMYPHPVLNIGDDMGGSLEIDLKVSSTGKEIEISPSFKLVNDDLQSLVDQRKVTFASHIYCRGTMYRSIFKSSKHIPAPIKIQSAKLNGEVEIDFFICASENIPTYQNSSFNSDYAGFTFSIDKGDILAYGGKGTFYAKKSPEELKSVSALMNISSTGKDNHPMYNDYTGQKITIMLCRSDYENYQIVKGSPSLWWNILLSCIVLPALTEALHYASSDESHEYSQSKWRKMLLEMKDRYKDGEMIRIAQKILDQPNNRSFSAMKQLIEEQ